MLHQQFVVDIRDGLELLFKQTNGDFTFLSLSLLVNTDKKRRSELINIDYWR